MDKIGFHHFRFINSPSKNNPALKFQIPANVGAH